MPTQRDIDCASLARDALFPLKISRDKIHPTQFPASEALDQVRQAVMVQQPDRAASSFFPPRVVVVRDVNDSSELKWNGQPDVSHTDASVQVIPNMLSIRCMECVNHGDNKAYIETKHSNDSSLSHGEIVLCSNRVLKRDYSHDKMPVAPQSLTAVEEVLAHQVTKVGDLLENEPQTSSTRTVCQTLAAMEIRAARAAECYYSKAGKEVRRGSALGPCGYSLLPKLLQERLRNKCIRSVATRATQQVYKSEGQKCVSQVFDEANRD